MKSYVQVKFLNILGGPVHVHWSALVVMGFLFVVSIKSPLYAVVTVCSYFGTILLHEAGHAYFAWRMGYRIRNIQLGLIHGTCTFDAPYELREECIIAWGGVAAQLVVAIPLIVISLTTPLNQLPLTGPIIAFLGYISVIIALFNLMPIMNLDGVKAWQFIPLQLKYMRNKAAAKKTAQDVIRRLKKQQK
jgi:Zn-dependent protease